MFEAYATYLFTGWFLRDAVTQKHTRDLYKTYGIWFRFYVTFKVGRFDLLNTLKILLVGFGSVKVCDIIFNFLVEHIFPKTRCFPVLKCDEYEKARHHVMADNIQPMEDRKACNAAPGENLQQMKDKKACNAALGDNLKQKEDREMKGTKKKREKIKNKKEKRK